VALLKGRKGFVRLALKTGAPLVPVYVFGNSKLLRLLKLPELFERMSRWSRISLTPFFGRFGLPIPFRLPLL
jgi:1-acyl-sn-glycerol-3-phosphate acyltransferase